MDSSKTGLIVLKPSFRPAVILIEIWNVLSSEGRDILPFVDCEADCFESTV